MANLILHFLLVIITLISGLTVKSTSVPRSAFYFLAITIYTTIFYTPYPNADPEVLYHVGLMGSFVLAASFDLLVLQSNIQQRLKHNKQTTPASEMGFFSRLKWGVNLLFNFRGANWNCAAPGLRYPNTTSRWQFVFTRLCWSGFYYLLADILGLYTKGHPAFTHPPSETFASRGLLLQAVNVMVFWTSTVSFMNQTNTLLSAITVALGLYEPEDWPSWFGVWLNTKSIRTFWGRSWHQGLRRSIQPQSKYLVNDILRIPPKSLPSTYTQLLICFFLSGFYHAVGDWLVLHDTSIALDSILFFVSQAFIITLEDFIIFLGKKVGILKVPTVISYLWVVMWLTVTCPPWMEAAVKGGYLDFSVKVSVVEMARNMIGI